MKRLLPILFFLLTGISFGATTVPIQLLNPSGSSSGQAIVSTGSTSAPTWGGPSASVLTGVAQYNVAVGGATGLAFVGPGSSGGFLISTGSSSYPAFGNTVSTLTATGLITPSGGIAGVTNGSNASAGAVGEYVCAQVTNGGSPSGCATNSSSPVSLTTATPANVTSISLTAGDWDICGDVYFNPNAATVVTTFIGQISTTSATLGTPPNLGSGFYAPVSETGLAYGASVGCMRQIFSSTTTIYLVAQSTFTTNTNAAYGYIWARRAR